MTADRRPTKQECVEAFWDVIGPALVDAYYKGLWHPDDYTEEKVRERSRCPECGASMYDPCLGVRGQERQYWHPARQALDWHRPQARRRGGEGGDALRRRLGTASEGRA